MRARVRNVMGSKVVNVHTMALYLPALGGAPSRGRALVVGVLARSRGLGGGHLEGNWAQREGEDGGRPRATLDSRQEPYPELPGRV